MGNTLRANELSPEATPLLELSSADQRQTWTLPQRKVFSRPVNCVLFVHFCAAFTTFSMRSNLTSFATNEEHLNFTSAEALILRKIFLGTMCVTLILGGWLADTKLGKFLVILFGTFICFIGAILLLLGSLKNTQVEDWATNALKAVYMIGLIFFAFGSGGLYSNTILFAVEQVSNNDPVIVRSLYLWYYWIVNFSALFVFAFDAFFTQQTFSFFYWNFVSVCLFVLALFVFLAGKQMYSIYPGYGSVLLTTLKVAKEAIKKSKRPLIIRSLLDHWLDRAKMCFGGSFSNWEVEDVKKVYRLLPLFATFIIYRAITYEMTTSMLYQGKYMDINLESILVPVAFLKELKTIAVLILIPFIGKVVYPFLEKFDICPSQLQRMGIGMLFASASMACAGGIEWYRVEQCCILQDREEKNLTSVSKITAFYQVPQYILVGLCEVFLFCTAFEFIYTETPRCLQGIVMGVYYCIIPSGRFTGTLLRLTVKAVTEEVGGSDNKWYPDKADINSGHHLAYYFFFLAVLVFLVFILYIFVALSFKAKKESAERANLDHIGWAQYAEISRRTEDTSTTSYDYYARHSTC